MSMTGLRVKRLAAALAVLAVVLAGCSSTKSDDSSGGPLAASVDQLYSQAKSEMASGTWDSAVKTLERLEGRAAGTVLAQQAQLDLAYVYWRSGDRAQALATVDRFIRELVCRVDSTRWPVSEACTATSAVSRSRISPTITTSGS